MALNCKHIIVSSIKVSQPLFLDYVDEIRSTLEYSLPNSIISDILKVVPQEHFVQEVLKDPQSTPRLSRRRHLLR